LTNTKPSNESDKGTNYDSSYQENQAAFFDCLGNNNSSFSDLFKPTPFWKLLKQARKSVQKAEKILNKISSAETSSNNRAQLVPKNATVRREYIKCGKPLCHRRHGPYYYAYWKDNNKKLKKKYIGRHFKRNSDNKQGDDTSSSIPAAMDTMKNNDVELNLEKLLDYNSNKIADNIDSPEEKTKSEEVKRKKKNKRVLSITN
jgi:hypothetical protein